MLASVTRCRVWVCLPDEDKCRWTSVEKLGDLTRMAWASGALDECERWNVRHGIRHGKMGASKWAQATDGCGDRQV